MSRALTRSERLDEMKMLYFVRAYSDIEMAERLGVDRTTAFRDRIALEQEHVFVQDEEGRWRLDRTRYLTNLKVNLAEALSLYLAARRTSQQTRVAHMPVASALEKLALTLHQPLTTRLVRAADQILAQRQDPTRTAVFATVAQAWIENRQLRLHYRAFGHDGERVHRFAPYLLEPSPWNDGIYLIGQSDLARKVITLKLDRIVGAALLGSFELPEDFNEEQLLRHAWGVWGGEGEPETVQLLFAPGLATRRLKESVWHPLEQITDMPDGGCLWQAPIADWQEMLPWIRGWGANVEVLAPVELRESLIAESIRLAMLYGTAGTGSVLQDGEQPLLLAHSANSQGKRQGLVDHLQAVAALTRDFAAAFEASDLGFVLGFWHDLGKFHPDFQDYLHEAEATGRRPGRTVDHKAAGVLFALEQRLDLLTLIIQGHHGGLQNRQLLQAWLEGTKEKAAFALKQAKDALPDLSLPLLPKYPHHILKQAKSAEFFGRMLFSALVDADFLDTEAHFSPHRIAQRGGVMAMKNLWACLEANQLKLVAQAAETPVNAQRRAIWQACVEAAAGPQGIYRLTVPTGGGKTRAGLAFALRHAAQHGLARVIVAVPYISITEQTAGIYREIFTPLSQEQPVVLEHHSSAVERGADPVDYDPNSLKARLAAENWDAPLVVTTTVQLFESLFAANTSRCRKLHNLARSVIVLDEVQALPTNLLDPILDSVRELCSHYGATVLMSTATQPAFETLPIFKQIEAREINPDLGGSFRALKRVEYEWVVDTPLVWSDIAGFVREASQVLAIVNTKKDALALMDALNDPDALHLSTLLCGAHRRAALQEVKRRLEAGLPCRLVSTQVVEAGVDIDFPLVLRALGPLSSIIQAAGRANREGKLPMGRVIVVDPAEGGMPPGGYKRASQTTRSALHQGPPDMDNPETVRRYFTSLFQIEETDRPQVQKSRAALDYVETAQRFRMIDQDTLDVVVPYGEANLQEEIQLTLADLRAGQTNPRVAMRALQPFLVSLYRHQAKTYLAQGLITEVLPGLGEWHGRYDAVRGLTAEGPTAGDLVV